MKILPLSLILSIALGSLACGESEESVSHSDLKSSNLAIAKTRSVVAPGLSFKEEPLSRVLETLSILSIKYDYTTSDEKDKGVNIVLLDPQRLNPRVTMTLRNVTLEQALNLITGSVGFQYDIQDGAVVVQPGQGHAGMETQIYEIPRSTVIRMIGDKKLRSREEEEEALRQFFARSGVKF